VGSEGFSPFPSPHSLVGSDGFVPMLIVHTVTWTVYTTPLMTLTTDLGLSIRVSMFEYVRLVTGTSS